MTPSNANIPGSLPIARLGGAAVPQVDNPPPMRQGESVVQESYGAMQGNGYSYAIMYQAATVADDVPAWGLYPYQRDMRLRALWPTEPIFASAFGSLIQRYSSLPWKVESESDALENAYTDMFNAVQEGKGWKALMTRTAIDLYTQDNGAWWELIRLGPTENDPVYTINALDSARCIRTGLREQPIWYRDIRGGMHPIKWFQVSELTEMPSPIEEARGLQYCAFTRCLRAAQLARDIGVYHREKISGRHAGQVHFVGGVQRSVIEAAFKLADNEADGRGQSRYINPIIVSSLDPNTTISKETVDLAALPDNFDFEQHMFWYMNNLALAFGVDHGEFAPVGGRGGGTGGSGTASAISHTKSRSKGPASFMETISQVINYHGIIARSAKFVFAEQDTMADMEIADLEKTHVQTAQVAVMANIITPKVAAQQMHASGYITDEQMAELEKDPEAWQAVTGIPGGPNAMPNGNTAIPGGAPRGRDSSQAPTSNSRRITNNTVTTRAQGKKSDTLRDELGWDAQDFAELEVELAAKRLEEQGA